MHAFDLRNWSGFLLAGGTADEPAMVDQIVIDTRRIHSSHALFVALKGAYRDGHQFVSSSHARYALVSKQWQGEPPGTTILRVDDPLSAFQEIVGCYRLQLEGDVIAVTGSYGKTMAKDLLHHLLSSTYSVVSSPESFNSQIGVPLSLLRANQSHHQIIIEAGFSYPGEAEKLSRMIRPTHAIVTRLSNKHLHTLGSKSLIAKEMSQLYAQEEGWTLLPKEDSLLPAQHPHFWDQSDSHLPQATTAENSGIITVKFPCGMQGKIAPPLGMHYIPDLFNIGIKAAHLLGVPPENILEALSSYQPEAMSTEIWKSPNGATYVNETYCGDAQSLDCALRHFDYQTPQGKKTLIFGGVKNEDPSIPACLGESIGKAQPDTLILTDSSPKLENAILMHAPGINILRYPSIKAALKQCAKSMRPEDILIIKGKKKLSFDHLTQATQGSIFANQLRINLAAISSNLKAIRSKISQGTEVMVMVKAMAYGTQGALIAKFLKTEGINYLGVSYIDEGIFLRQEGVDQRIFVLNAAPYEVKKAVEWEFEVAVDSVDTIEHIGRLSGEERKITSVHLHIDTGMSRLGCRPEEALSLAKQIHAHPHLKLQGVMTHFACAEDKQQDPFTLEQSHAFDRCLAAIDQAAIPIPYRHACNSQAALRFDFPQYNLIRTGIALYGLYPGGTLALSLHSRIVGINHCLKGETVSYGRSYTVQKEKERIAVIPIGYHDGLHLNYSGRAAVMIQGIKAPIVGKICMDYLMADITHIHDACAGDPVLIFGEDAEGNLLSPEELASQGNSSVYELITCLGPRIQRVFVHEENEKIT